MLKNIIIRHKIANFAPVIVNLPRVLTFFAGRKFN